MTPLSRLPALALGVLMLAGAWGTTGLAQTRCGGALTGGLPSDCVLEAAALSLGFDYTPSAEDGRRGTLTVTQATAEGGARDIAGPFDVVGQLAPPVLRDLNEDALPELVVQSRPTAFDIWLLGPNGFYDMAGRISARSVDDIEARGALTVANVRLANGLITQTAYLLDAGTVATVFQMQINPDTRSCTLIGAPDASQDWLNTTILIADCEAQDWN